MKILIFGRGVISTEYAWAFEKKGHEIEFYVRPGRASKYGSFINLDFNDGRLGGKGTIVKEKWHVKFCEEIKKDHNYDLILLSLNHNQIPDAVKYLTPRIGNATVLVFNNFWEDPEKAIYPLFKTYKTV